MTIAQRTWDLLTASPVPLTVQAIADTLDTGHHAVTNALERYLRRSFVRATIIVAPSGRKAQTWKALPDRRPIADGRGRPSHDVGESECAVEAQLQRIEAQAKARRRGLAA